jgi:hypothetical protein
MPKSGFGGVPDAAAALGCPYVVRIGLQSPFAAGALTYPEQS